MCSNIFSLRWSKETYGERDQKTMKRLVLVQWDPVITATDIKVTLI